MLNRIVIDVVETICFKTDNYTFENIRLIVLKINNESTVERLRTKIIYTPVSRKYQKYIFDTVYHNYYDKPAL